MMNDKENAITTVDEYEQESFDLDALEQKLEEEIGDHLSSLEQLKEEHKLIGNPDGIGTVVLNSVWEQFITQVGVVAGEDFIEANRGLTLDLRDEAFIQTTENFAHGKIVSHNPYIDYQKRYDEMRADFQTDPTIEVKISSNMRYNDDNKTYEIIIVQGKMRDISAEQLARKKEQVTSSISERHAEMSKAMRASLENIYADDTKQDHQETKSEIERLLGGMSTGKA